MKKILLFLAVFLPFIAQAQVNMILQKTVATGVVRAYNTGTAGIDTLVNAGIGTNGFVPVYNSTLKKSVWTNPSSFSAAISFGTFGSTPNAQGGSYSSGVITLQPASASFPGGVTTGTQTFAGQKTFSTGLTGTLTGSASLLNGFASDTSGTINTISRRDANGDLFSRTFFMNPSYGDFSPNKLVGTSATGQIREMSQAQALSYLNISGSYLPLAGGTLTGTLAGTAINLSGNLATSSGTVSAFTGAFNNGLFNNTTNATNDLGLPANSGTTDSYIGTGFGALFIQNNNFFNGTTYSFPNPALPSSNVNLSGGTVSFQTGIAGADPTTKFTLDVIGDVGLGASPVSLSAGYKTLDIRGSSGGSVSLGIIGSGNRGYIFSDAGALVMATSDARPVQIATGATTRYTIDGTTGNNTWTGAGTFAGGITAANVNSNTYIQSNRGTTNTVYTNGEFYGSSSLWSIRTNTSSGFALDMFNGGSAINALTMSSAGAATFVGSITATSFLESSDLRYKNIISRTPSASGFDMIAFKWKPELKRDNFVHYGYVAQEVKKIMPNQVVVDDKGFMSVNYTDVLVKKMSDLEARIKKLEK
jgi:hypothetical protein